MANNPQSGNVNNSAGSILGSVANAAGGVR